MQPLHKGAFRWPHAAGQPKELTRPGFAFITPGTLRAGGFD
jgi:hypothetical protein